jgi:hypothetical protein
MPDRFIVLPIEVNHRFLLAREEVTAALKALGDMDGTGSAAQYQALVDARHKVAQVYREARSVDNRTALDQTLWFALDEAALWQDQQAARYGHPSVGLQESGSPLE